ncbi:MAG: hypothetical protein Q9225_005111 [Loekoesia sp. 1 TL-2023]
MSPSASVPRDGSASFERSYHLSLPALTNGHQPPVLPGPHVSLPPAGALYPNNSTPSNTSTVPFHQATATEHESLDIDSPFINKPVVVSRPPPTLADNPGPAMTKISQQIYNNQLSSDCQVYNMTPPAFFRIHPFFDHIFVSAAIFTHFARPPLVWPTNSARCPYIEPRLLMLKRSASDNDYPNCWEIPGGTCGSTEQSIFHGLAREVWLQTNLNISFIVRQSGKGTIFTSDYKIRNETTDDENWLKVCFEVHCQEIQEISSYQAFLNEDNFQEMVNNIPIRLFKQHYQSWAWMTKEGIKLILEGAIPGEQFVNKEQGRMAMRAFEIRENQGTQPGQRRSQVPRSGKRRREVETSNSEEAQDR